MNPRSRRSDPVPSAPASYTRISSDPAADQLGVKRQQLENAERAAREGWPEPKLYSDNDVSAYGGKTRPAYEQLLADIAAGEVDGLVVWHVDRLYRRPVDLEALIDLLDARPDFPILTVTAGEIDLGAPAGRMIARTLVNLARYESEHRAERLRSKHRELAQAGKQAGGGTRPFGFQADRMSIDKEEAKLIKAAVGDVLAGIPLRSVAADWNRRGVATVTGVPWTTQVLRRMLTSPRIAGRREHHGEVVSDACWRPIIDRASHERLRSLLLDPARASRRRPATRYLLTGGTARCGLCGAALVARPRGDGQRSYVCATGPGFSGCGKIRVIAEPFEDLVTEGVLVAIDTPELATQLAKGAEQPDEALDEVTEGEARRAELAELWAAGEITRSEWLTARTAVEQRIETARARLTRAAGAGAAQRLLASPGKLRARWGDLDLDRRRAVVGAVVDRVVVGPAVRGFNRFDPARVEVVWRA